MGLCSVGPGKGLVSQVAGTCHSGFVGVLPLTHWKAEVKCGRTPISRNIGCDVQHLQLEQGATPR